MNTNLPSSSNLPWIATTLNRLPASIHTLASHRVFGLILYTAAALCLFLLLENIMSRVVRLPGAAYAQPYLSIELIKHLGLAICTVLALALAVLARFGALLARWDDFEHGRVLRGFIVFLCLMMAWPMLTHGYNYYFDQGYYPDRLILALLVISIAWRPVFILPFLLLLYALLGQLIEPSLGGSVLAHKTQVLKVLELFAAALLLHAITASRKTDYFVFLTLCGVASAYWVPALAKMQLDWVAGDRLDLIPLAAYAHGWLGFLDAEQIVALSSTLAGPFNTFLLFCVLAIEGLFLILLFRRSLSVGLLIAAILFHCAVFALYGFLFWTWIALDAALLYLLWRYFKSNGLQRVYRPAPLLLSMLLIGFGSYWFKPPVLAWYDTPLAYTYRIEATTSENEVLSLHPRFFAPFEDAFTMAAMSYLVSDHAVLTSAYGVTHSANIKQALMSAQTAEDVFALEHAQESIRYSEKRSEKFYRFLVEFVSHRNQRGDLATSLYQLHSPLQFWTQRDGTTRLHNKRIKQIRVYERTQFFNGQTLNVIRTRHLKTLDIPDEETVTSELP